MLAGGILSLPLFAAPSAQTDPRGGTKVPPYVTEYLSYEQARPVFDALGESLPPTSAWGEWIAAADRATRARVAQGDETSLVNMLLFGTSFKKEPRVTSRQLDEKLIGNAVAGRLIDFERALATVVRRDSSRALPAPGTDDRLLFARQTLGEGSSVRARLLSTLERMISENDTHQRLVQDAQALGDPSLEFAERSRMYRTRGLSSDTSIRTNFAVEEALRGLTPVLYGGQTPKYAASPSSVPDSILRTSRRATTSIRSRRFSRSPSWTPWFGSASPAPMS